MSKALKALEEFNKILEYKIDVEQDANYLKEKNLGFDISMYDVIDSNLPDELNLVFEALEKLKKTEHILKRLLKLLEVDDETSTDV